MAVLPPDPIYCLKSDMGYIHSLCFPQTEDYTSSLLAATESGFVYFWDLETNRLQHKQSMGEAIQAVHSLGHNIITQEKDGSVKLWCIENNSSYVLSKTYACGGGYCRSILLDDKLVVPQENSTLDIVDIKTMTKLNRLTPHKSKLGLVMCIQNIKLAGRLYVLAGYETGDIILWDYETAKPCGHIKLREYITSLTFDPVSWRGICGNASNTLQIFMIDRNFNITLKCEICITNEGCNVVKLRDDRKIFVSGGWDGSLRLFSWKSLRVLVVLKEHKGGVTDIQFSPRTVRYWESNIMAAAGADGTISLWNLYN